MIWIILGVIVTIILGVCCYRETDSFGLACIVSFVVGICALLISAIMIFSLSGIPSYENRIYEKETIPVIALTDSQDVYGRTGFLGSGYVNEKLYYYYMTDTDKGYKVDKISADNTYIKYSDEPRIEKFKNVGFKNKWDNLYTCPMVDYYIIYIPEGTIIENYRIDLE